MSVVLVATSVYKGVTYITLIV